MSKILTTSSYLDTDDKAGFLVWRSCRYNDTTGYSTGDNMDMGFDPSESDADRTKMLFFRFNIPDIADYGIPTNSIIEGLKLRLHVRSQSGGASGADPFVIKAYTVNSNYRDWVEGVAHGTKYDGVSTWDIAYDATTVVYETYLDSFTVDWPSDSDLKYLDLEYFIQRENKNFGDRIDIAVYQTVDDSSRGFDFDDADDGEMPAVAVVYSVPKPTKAQMGIAAADDGINAIITPTSHAESEDLASYIFAYHTTEGSLAYNTNAITTTDIGAKSYSTKAVWAGGTAPLANENDTYHFKVFAQDSVHTNANASTSNVFTATRPAITSVATSGFSNTGDTGSMVVTAATGGDWSSNGAAALKYLYVNWDGPATGASISDDGVSKIEITAENATAVTRTHTYSTPNTKYVWVAIEDTLGFRSGFHRVDDNDDNTGGVDNNIASPATLPNPSATAPTAVATVSKKTNLHTKYGLLDDVNVVGGVKSVAGVSDSQVYHYLWKHTNTDCIVTAYPTANDNSYFQDASDAVRCNCNWGAGDGTSTDMDDARLTVYGLASFYDNNGTDTAVADSHSNFATSGFYKMAKSEIAPPHSNPAAGGSYGVASDNYFKRIDMIAVTTRPSNESDTYPVFYNVVTSTGTVSVINNKLCAIHNNNFWGGYVTANISSGTTDTTSNYIEKSGVDYFSLGFRPDMKVYVTWATDTSLNGVYTISTMTPNGNRISFKENLSGTIGAQNLTITSDTREHVTIPYVTYSTDTKDFHDFTLSVSQNRDASSLATNAITVNQRVPEELNLETLVDNGHIAILSSEITRQGGLTAKMSLGDVAYPSGITRTNIGMPTLSMQIRILTQDGLRQMLAYIDSNRYDWAHVDSDRIDAPSTANRTYLLKLNSGTVTKTPESATQYIASLSCIIVGEKI